MGVIKSDVGRASKNCQTEIKTRKYVLILSILS